ncbi:MAG: DUF3082 domain-containing protein [Nostoc sp.]|uniref:DUF3082 domain-containing protein n=1 Tax=Nostoc sp. TaxID=1180 RepID=UPI002FF5EDD5
MSEPNLTPQTDIKIQAAASPLRCLIGAIISGGMGYAMYSLMIAIATNFASKPLHSINPLVIKISSAVRTLVVGVVALGSGIFSIVAIGLLALGVQLLVQQLTKENSSEN